MYRKLYNNEVAIFRMLLTKHQTVVLVVSMARWERNEWSPSCWWLVNFIAMISSPCEQERPETKKNTRISRREKLLCASLHILKVGHQEMNYYAHIKVLWESWWQRIQTSTPSIFNYWEHCTFRIKSF